MFEKLKKRSWFSFCPQITTNCVYCLGFFTQIRVSRWSLSHSPPQFQWLIMPLSVAAREERRDHRDNSREAGKRGVDSPTRSEWCPRFCFQCWDQWACCSCQRGQAEKTGGPAETDVLTESTCTGRRPSFAERRGGPLPLFWLKQRWWEKLRETGCWCKLDQIQSDLHPDKVFSLHFNMCEILQQHEKVMNSSTPPPHLLLYYVTMLQTCHIMNYFPSCTRKLFQIKIRICSLILLMRVQLLFASACSFTSTYLMYIALF